MGLPVPAESARVERVAELHYHAKTQGTLDAGAFEATLRDFGGLVTGISSDRPIMVLVDELESITEPGAAATIIAGILEALGERNATGVFVSPPRGRRHRRRRHRPHRRRHPGRGPRRGRTPRESLAGQGTLARSTPELIVEKLAESEAERREASNNASGETASDGETDGDERRRARRWFLR